MASTLNFEGMLAEIVRQDAAKLDIVADTRRMSSFVEDNRLGISVDRDGGTQPFALNGHAFGQVATDLGIPKRYAERMLSDAPSLLTRNVDHWLAEEPNRRLLRGFKPSSEDGSGTGRAWLSDRYRRLDNIEVAKRIFPVFDDVAGLEFHQAQLTDTKFYLRAVLPRMQAEVAVGDVVQAGLEIRNSEVGAGALVVQPFILRLICTNGMTVADAGVNRRHVGKRIEDDSIFSDEALKADDNAFWLVLRDTVKSVLTEVRFQEIVATLAESMRGEKIQRPIAASEELQQRYSLSDGEREAVLTNLVAGNDLSRWGALNALTATAKTVESFDRQAELEALGWTLATASTREWEAVAIAR